MLRIFYDRDSRIVAAIMAFAIFATIIILLGMDLSVGQTTKSAVCERPVDLPSDAPVGSCQPSDITLD